MVSDDAIFLPKSLFGMADIGWGAPTVHLLVDLLSNLQSLNLFKIVSLAVYSAASNIIAVIFFRYVNGVMLAILLGLVIGGSASLCRLGNLCYRLSSHLCPVFYSVALLAFDHVRGISGVSFIIAHLGVPSILFGAAFSSPVAFLAPVALPIWLVIAWSISGKSERQLWEWLAALGASILLGLVMYVWTGLGNYHYTGLVGWTEFTPSRVLQNLLSGASRTAMIYGDARSTTFLLFLSGAAVAITAFVHQWWADRARPASNSYKPSSSSSHRLVLGLNALVASALTFGPVSITTRLSDRYLVDRGSGSNGGSGLNLDFFKPLTGWRRVAALGFLVLVVGLTSRVPNSP